MTELLQGFFQSHLGRSPFDQMPDQSDHQWRQQHQYYNSIPTLSGWQQQNQAEQMPDAQGIDVSRMYPQDAQSYQPYGGGSHASMPPTYQHHDSWASDMDIGTPSTAGFPSEDTYHHPAQPFGHLRIPANTAAGAHSPQSSHSGISPQLPRARLEPERPAYGRSLTDPTQKRRATAPAAAGAKHPSSDEEDEDFVPAAEEATAKSSNTHSKGGRGKRQRIPHTAVERRYRENLNAHLDKLRQTVPSLASRAGSGKEGDVGGVKPSKCEILSGAIDHIGAIERENAALRNEVRALRQQVGEFEAWYRR